MSEKAGSWPQPKWIKAFLATAEDGNQSAAARRLGCTASKVNRNIAALEEWARTPLFTRDQPAELTALGVQFRVLVEETQGKFDDFLILPTIRQTAAQKAIPAKDLKV